MSLVPQKHKVSVSEWHKMGEYNIFPPEARMELIKGEIIDMAPIGPSHASCVRHLIELFASQKGKSALIDVQNPIQLGDLSDYKIASVRCVLYINPFTLYIIKWCVGRSLIPVNENLE